MNQHFIELIPYSPLAVSFYLVLLLLTSWVLKLTFQLLTKESLPFLQAFLMQLGLIFIGLAISPIMVLLGSFKPIISILVITFYYKTLLPNDTSIKNGFILALSQRVLLSALSFVLVQWGTPIVSLFQASPQPDAVQTAPQKMEKKAPELPPSQKPISALLDRQPTAPKAPSRHYLEEASDVFEIQESGVITQPLKEYYPYQEKSAP